MAAPRFVSWRLWAGEPLGPTEGFCGAGRRLRRGYLGRDEGNRFSGVGNRRGDDRGLFERFVNGAFVGDLA